MPGKQVDAEAVIKQFTVHMQQMQSAIVSALDAFKVLQVSAGQLVSSFNSVAFSLSQIGTYVKFFDEQLKGFGNSVKGLGLGFSWLNPQVRKFGKELLDLTKPFATLGLAAAAAGEFFMNSSPDLAATVRGSLSLIAGQFGSILMPAFVQVVAALQDFWRWLKELSPAGKQLVQFLFAFLAGMLGVRVALAGLAFALTPLVSVVRLAASGFQMLYARTGVLGVALAGASLAAYAFVSSLEKQADRLEKYNNRDNRWSEAEMEEMSDLKKKADQIKDPEERIKFLQAEERRRREAEQKAIEEEKTPNPGSFWGKAMESIVPGERSPRDMDLDRLSRLERERLEASQLLENERRKQQGLAPAYPSTDRTRRQDSARKSYLFDTVTNNQPVFSQIGDIYRKIQLSALGPSPLEQAQKQMHREQMLEMLKQLRSLEQIEKNTSRNGGLS